MNCQSGNSVNLTQPEVKEDFVIGDLFTNRAPASVSPLRHNTTFEEELFLSPDPTGSEIDQADDCIEVHPSPDTAYPDFSDISGLDQYVSTY